MSSLPGFIALKRRYASNKKGTLQSKQACKEGSTLARRNTFYSACGTIQEPALGI